MTHPQRGIYVHIPWCRVRCAYCNFVVAPEAEGAAPWKGFTDALIREYGLRQGCLGGAPTTLGIGGGTPSRMPIAQMARLIGAFPNMRDISVEANPEDVTSEWVDGAAAAGVTRVSLGVQTWTESHARTLGRAHTAKMADEALEHLKGGDLDSWSLDLMFALPGQTLEDLDRDLSHALRHDPPHLSLYGLTWEPGTGLDRLRKRGRLRPVEDDLWRSMYDHLRNRLRDHGLYQYEVSNFARPGHESQHNLGYWTGAPYLGLGPGAHGFSAEGRRWVNLADWRAYMHAPDPTLSEEVPRPEQAATDYLLSALRWVGGVDLAHLKHISGHRIDPSVLSHMTAMGLVHQPSIGHCALTRDGMPIADQVIQRLIDGLDVMQSPTGGL